MAASGPAGPGGDPWNPRCGPVPSSPGRGLGTAYHWRRGPSAHRRSEEQTHAQRTTEANPSGDGCRADGGVPAAIGPGGRGRTAAPGGGQPLRARITGTPIPGTSTTARRCSGRRQRAALEERPDQGAHAVLAKMKKNFAKFARDTPGPADIFDYNIGALWRQGIDGAGTTIAVMEGWHFLDIYAARSPGSTRYSGCRTRRSRRSTRRARCRPSARPAWSSCRATGHATRGRAN